ncbi:MAG: class I SAM-dependent methyltransferase [Magnetococcales bacterium]|nr:class I SAM-dependent methyltransferase [Magnetococcales bacterium]
MTQERDHPLHFSIHSRLRLAHLRRLMPPAAGGRLLDVGCGLGYLTMALGEGYRCVGLDADFGSVNANRQRGLPGMVQGRLDRLPFADDTFAVAICSEVLEHLPDGADAAALAEIARVVQPGGRILVTVPALEGVRATSRLRNLGHDDPNGGEYHYRMGYAWQDLATLIAGIPGLQVATHRYAMFLLSELAMDLLKWVYFKQNSLKEHAHIMDTKNTPLFRIYRRLFPLMHLVFVLEDRLLASWLKGHIHILALERVADGRGRS